MLSAANTVVPLKYNARREERSGDPPDIRSYAGKSHYLHKILREWYCHIPHHEMHLILWIFDKTVEWGKRSEYLTYRVMENGNGRACGTGIKRRALINTIASLEAKKLIFVDRLEANERGLKIEINLEWNPETAMLAVPKRLQSGAVECTTPVQSDAPPPCTPVHPIRKKLYQNNSSENKGGPASLPLDTAPRSASQDFYTACGGLRSEPPARPKETSTTPAAPPPSFTTVEHLMAPAVGRTKQRFEKVSRILKPGALEETFRLAFGEHFDQQPGAIFPAWTPKDMGMVKNMFIKRWPKTRTAEEAHAFVRWSVANWSAMMSRPCFSWMKRDRPPEFPELSFWLRHHANFLVEMGRESTNRWISDMKDFEQREFTRLTIKEGMSPDAARMQIAEGRAVRKMREENQREKEKAVQTWKVADLKLKEAEKKLKGAEQGGRPIHPQSQAAQEMRRAEEDARRLAYRKEHNIQPLAEGEVPDLVAACEIGWKNAPWNQPLPMAN